MSKYHYSIEPKVNNYAPSVDYGKIFGWSVFDNNANKIVKTYLLHETGYMLSGYPFGIKTKKWAHELAKKNGFDGKVYY